MVQRADAEIPLGEDLVPVSVVGGYLGAGKTTLINHLLSSNHGQRLAVLVNDFGAINIDAELLAAHDGDTISLSNGCVCCAIGDALGDSLDRVLEADPRPDRIVIEASGVADPSSVAGYGQGWPGCRLDAVVVLADAETIRASAVDRFVGSTVLQQLRSGGVLVLTKVDLVTDEVREAVQAWLGEVAPDAAVMMSTVAASASAILLGGDEMMAGPTLESSSSPADLAPADMLFESFTVTLDGATRTELDAALTAWTPDVIRVKGFARLDDASGGEVVRVDRVGTRVAIERAPQTQSMGTGLVVIALRGRVEPGDLATPQAGE